MFLLSNIFALLIFHSHDLFLITCTACYLLEFCSALVWEIEKKIVKHNTVILNQKSSPGYLAPEQDDLQLFAADNCGLHSYLISIHKPHLNIYIKY